MKDNRGNSLQGSEREESDDAPLVWSVEVTAKKLGRSRMAIYHLLRRDAIPAHKCGGRWVFFPEEIRAWLTNKKGATHARR